MEQYIRQKIWFEIEETERMIRYFSPVKDRYIVQNSSLHKWQFILSGGLLVITPLISWASDNTPVFWTLLAVQITVVIGLFYSFMGKSNSKLGTIVEMLDAVLEKSKEVSREMQNLWDDCERDKVGHQP